MSVEVFRDRNDAGKQLGEQLATRTWENAIVLAVPRGGVPVGFEVAKRLGLQLDIIVPRKIPIPWSPEAGFGAVTPDGTVVLNEPLVRELELTNEEIEQAVEDVQKEIARRMEYYRSGEPAPDITGRSVLIVDDGLASGYTMLAAIESIRKLGASSVIVAVPVASASATRLISETADEFITLEVSDELPFAVASFYKEWQDVTDSEILNYLHWQK